jgi:hypothetical protein
MARFFSNQANKSSNSTLAPPKSTAKRPRVINAEDLFAKNHSAQLRDAIKVLQDASGASSHTGEENLALYRTVKADAFSKLSDSDKEKWQGQAAEYNERAKHLPPIEHIFE